MVLKPSRLTASRSLKGSLFSKRTWKAPVNLTISMGCNQAPISVTKNVRLYVSGLFTTQNHPILQWQKMDNLQNLQSRPFPDNPTSVHLALKERLTSASCWAQSSCTEDKKSASARSSHDQSSGRASARLAKLRRRLLTSSKLGKEQHGFEHVLYLQYI